MLTRSFQLCSYAERDRPEIAIENMRTLIRVVIVGHSYVRRLSRPCARTRTERISDSLIISWIFVLFLFLVGLWISAGIQSWKKVIEIRRLQPDVVFFQIGENHVNAVEADTIGQLMVNLVGHFQLTSCVVFSSLMPMPYLQGKATAINTVLGERIKECSNAILWKDKGGFTRTDRFASDGCHLRDSGMAVSEQPLPGVSVELLVGNFRQLLNTVLI